MEEILKEFEDYYNKMCEEEMREIYQLAEEHYKKIKRAESHVQSSQLYDFKNKSIIKATVSLLAGKETTHSSFEDLTKVTQFDQEHYFQYEQEVREKNPERTQIMFDIQAFLKIFNSDISSIFVEFDELKKIFNYLHTSAYKQVRVFVDIIKNNGLLGMGKTEFFLPNYDALINYKYQYIRPEEVDDILLNEKLEEFLLEENPQNILGQIELFQRFKATREDYTAIFQATLELDRLFSTKVYDLTEDDYKKIQEKVEFLSFGDIKDRIIKQMREYAKTYNKRKAKNNKEKDQQYEEKEIINIPKKTTNLNKALREISRYYDVDTKELKEMLSMDQIIYIISLMYNIDMEKNIIEEFLRKATRELKKLHPFAIYNQEYDKFAFLASENPDIKEHLEMLEYIFSAENSIFICDEEKYVEIKELVGEEIDELIRITNGDYTYEIESAKKLCKENQE